MRPAGCGPPPREEIAAFWSSTSSSSAPPVDVKAQDVMVIRLFWHKCQLWWIISLCCYVLCRNLCNVNLYFFVYPAGQKSDFLHSFYLALLHYQVLSGRKSWSPTPLLLFWCEHELIGLSSAWPRLSVHEQQQENNAGANFTYLWMRTSSDVSQSGSLRVFFSGLFSVWLPAQPLWYDWYLRNQITAEGYRSNWITKRGRRYRRRHCPSSGSFTVISVFLFSPVVSLPPWWCEVINQLKMFLCWWLNATNWWGSLHQDGWYRRGIPADDCGMSSCNLIHFLVSFMWTQLDPSGSQWDQNQTLFQSGVMKTNDSKKTGQKHVRPGRHSPSQCVCGFVERWDGQSGWEWRLQQRH